MTKKVLEYKNALLALQLCLYRDRGFQALAHLVTRLFQVARKHTRIIATAHQTHHVKVQRVTLAHVGDSPSLGHNLGPSIPIYTNVNSTARSHTHTIKL